MNGYNFTERVRHVLATARTEANRYHHQYVGTEHILIALMREDGGTAIHVVRNLGAEPQALIHRIESTIQRGAPAGERVDLPYTSRAKKVLELAMSEARTLNHSYVGVEHILLGLIAEEKGIAAQVLAEVGITLPAAREEVVALVGVPVENADAAVPSNGLLAHLFREASEVVRIKGPPVEIVLRKGDALSRRTFADIATAIEYLKQEQSVSS